MKPVKDLLKKFLAKHKRIERWSILSAKNLLIRPYLSYLNVPIVAVTGTNGKTTVARLLSRIYQAAGYNVGCSTTDGVTHNARTIVKGDYAGILGVWHASRCPGVDILILETARGGILDYGIAFKQCTIGVM